nr:hypothetical protein [uncultured Campylobacter sp.]
MQEADYVNEHNKPTSGDKIYAEAALRAKQTRVNLCLIRATASFAAEF